MADANVNPVPDITLTASTTAPAPHPASAVANPATRALMLDAIHFDAQGLVPVIAQQHDTGEVLMMAWMNREAAEETLSTGRVCYYSRSRGRLWRKGESSGQMQTLMDFRLDCDGDTVLALVDQKGVACHTGRRNCFFNALRGDALVAITEPEISPEALYGADHAHHHHHGPRPA